jgi:hypothetical protein
MSIALVNLRAAIATNTLNALQQGALTQALDAIIPTFPEPDPSGVAQPPPDEDDSREWIAALYTIQAAGGSGGGVVTSGTIIAADGPTLSAIVVTTLPNGQPAIVNSFGAEFTLQPIDGMTVDGSTVLSTPDVTRVWERGDTVIAEQAALQTAWVVDPVGGNDNNTGLSALAAVKHKAEIARRYGSWSPTIDGIVVQIAYENPDTTAHDPSLFTPNLINGAQFMQFAATPATSFTGTLLAVTPKNKASAATCTPLRSTFTTATGAMAAQLLLINTTRGNSRAIAQRNTGGGLWQISQPFAPQTGLGFPSNTEVDTWANGDAIQGFALMNVHFGVVGGRCVDPPAGFAGPGHIVQALNFWDPIDSGIQPVEFDGGSLFQIQECTCSASPVVDGTSSIGATMTNVGIASNGNTFTNRGLGFTFTGGLLQGGFAISFAGQLSGMQLDTIIATGSAEFFDLAGVADFAIDTGTTINVIDGLAVTGIVYGVHGALGTLNAQSGLTRYTNTAVAHLMATLNIGGQITPQAYSNHTPGGVGTATSVALVALTPAALDAAAGVAGFGGMAYVPGVGGFYDGGVLP